MLKKHIISFLLLVTILLPNAAAARVSPNIDDMRGVWVSTVYNIDYPSQMGLSADQLKAEADTILDKVASMNLNAVFLQVRPSADAIYKSSIFPWSRFISGTAGQAPDGDFDVLEYWVNAAHNRGLQLHAWLNPYRVVAGGKSEMDSLPDSSPAKMHPEWVIEHEGKYYFDPGLPAVQQLVLSGAEEIVKGYDVDGIHLDDYFYPDPTFNDASTYERYGSGFDNINDWRRNNVNTLIASMDKSLHELNPNLSFGVSPAGIWDNKEDNPRGSETRGNSSYSQLYCDSLEWIEKGTVDYICPQLYWSIGYRIADFKVLTKWWQDAVSTSDVALYIGMGAYRSEDASPGDKWYGTAEIKRQLALIDESIDIQGEVYFSYSSLANIAGYPELLAEHYASRSNNSKPAAPTETHDNLIEIISQFITELFY